MAVDAGTAMIDIVADDSQAAQAFSRTQVRLMTLSQSLGSLGRSGLAFAGAAKFAEFFAQRSFAEIGVQVTKISQASGIAADTVMALGFAGAQSGLGLDEMGGALTGIVDKIREAHMGRDATTLGLVGALGHEINNLARLNPGEQFQAITRSLAGIEDPARRARIAIRLFGESGGLIARSANNFGVFQQAAQRAGLVMSRDTLDAAADLSGTMQFLRLALRSVVGVIGEALAPKLQTLKIMVLANAATVISWIRAGRDWVQSLSTSVLAISAVSVGIIGLSVAIKILSLVMTPLLLSWLKFGVVVYMASRSFGYAMESLAEHAPGVIQYLVNTFGGLGNSIGGMFRQIGAIAGTAWNGIVASLMVGDLQGAAEIATLGIKAAWQTLGLELRGIWEEFKLWFQQSLIEIGGYFQHLKADWKAMWAEMTETTSSGRWMDNVSFGLAAVYSSVFGAEGQVAELQGMMAERDRRNANPEARRRQIQEQRVREQNQNAANTQIRINVARQEAEGRVRDVRGAVANEQGRIREDLQRRANDAMWAAAEHGGDVRNQFTPPEFTPIRPEQIRGSTGSFNAFAFSDMGAYIFGPMDRMVILQQQANERLAAIREAILNRRVVLG